jgi:hypothetical protein
VALSGGNGAYTISSNSNTSAVSLGLSGTTLTVSGLAAGSATITVCDTSNTNTCGTLSVTVTGSSSTSSQVIVFSVTNPTLAVGQSLNVNISGSAPSYFIFSNANAGVAQGNMATGNTISLSGVSAGTDSISICATGGAGCLPLSVTVTGSVSTPVVATTPAVTQPTTSTTPTVSVGTSVANTALLAEIQTLQTAVTQVLTQIQSIQTQINQLEAQVNAGSGSGISTNVSASTATNVSSGTSGNFTELLTVGSQDAQVTALQNKLATLGFFSGSITGYYGTLTQEAVIKYQTAHGISATGSVGPSTRAALNAGE